jgi:hypothetical protein
MVGDPEVDQLLQRLNAVAKERGELALTIRVVGLLARKEVQGAILGAE